MLTGSNTESDGIRQMGCLMKTWVNHSVSQIWRKRQMEKWLQLWNCHLCKEDAQVETKIRWKSGYSCETVICARGCTGRNENQGRNWLTWKQAIRQVCACIKCIPFLTNMLRHLQYVRNIRIFDWCWNHYNCSTLIQNALAIIASHHLQQQ